MLKLYKRVRTGIRYWEAWTFGAEVVVHEGRLGDRGKRKFLTPKAGQTPTRCLREAARKPRADGYRTIPRARHVQIVVQFRTGPEDKLLEDLDKGHRIEDLFNECLGWTGNGRCTGNDIGGGTLNIFSVVVDPDLGATTLVEELRTNRLLKGAVVAVEEGEDYRVVYPTRFKGEFSLF
jgi:hypothetical protein